MSGKISDYRVLLLKLDSSLKIEDPYGRFRSEIGYVKPPEDGGEVPIVWLDRGIIVGKGTFLPYGCFTAIVEAREAPSGAPDAPEASEGDESPSEPPESPQQPAAAPQTPSRGQARGKKRRR